VVFVLDGGRLWVTTARRSVKARAWRRDRTVAGLVANGDSAVSFRGGVATFDAFDPLSWPGAVAAGPRLVEAASRFSLKNARFFAGYAVDAGRVPLGWTPPGRLFAAIRPSEGCVLDQDGPAVWGGYGRPAGFAARFAPLPRARGLDLRVPAEVRSKAGTAGSGALALDTGGGISVVPVRWHRAGGTGSYEAVVERRTLELAGGGPRSPAALTVDHASRWRAADMAGMLLQGSAELFDPRRTRRGRAALLERLAGRDDLVLVRLKPHRVVWWQGWDSGSVTAPVRGGRVG